MHYLKHLNAITHKCALLCAMTVLGLLLAGCSDSSGDRNRGENPNTLALREVASDTLTFRAFDDPMASEIDVTLTGATFYRGEWVGFDRLRTEVYVVTNPMGSIARVLLGINGGTGTDPRFFLDSVHDHQAMLFFSQRGLHPNDLLNECPLGQELIDCLLDAPDLRDFDPESNGRDWQNMVRFLSDALTASTETIAAADANTATSVAAEEARRILGPAFDTSDPLFNVVTGSYGATILAYALEHSQDSPEPLSLGRIFIDGPSSPGEFVITDGFRNGRETITNFLNAIKMSDTDQVGFLNALRLRHTAPSSTPTDDVGYNADDGLSSSHIFHYMLKRYDDIGGITDDTERQNAIEALRTALIDVANGDADEAAREAISNSDVLNPFEQSQTKWEFHLIDLTASTSVTVTVDGIEITTGTFSARLLGGRRSLGFTSRIAQICSAYIIRENGDSLARFEAALAEDANNPYWYGFLISYRQLLTVCEDARGNIRNNIQIPDASALDIDAEAIVQYGAGLDEKHHQVDIMEMESYFSSDTIVESIYVSDQLQGGTGPFNQGCLESLISTTFETTTSTLSAAIDMVNAASCGN